METPFLVLLEHAELAAAGDRRAARAEADRRVQQARLEAQAIETAAPEAVAAAIAARRRQIRDLALREVSSLEQALVAIEGEGRGEDAAATGQFERAVEQIVAAVLGETAGP